MATPQIPGYRDLRLIGRGGFAEVYAAEQPSFGGRLVAVKVLTVDGLDEGALQRFERECHAAGRISWHPNVVNVYDSGVTDDDRPYLVMEHMGRGSLADLSAQQPLSWQEAVAFAIPLAGALEAAHRTGTLHRDVKPQNILIGHLDEPKLADFGIARVEGSTASTSRTMRATLAHAPPEALDGRSSVAGDVYSLASTTHELIRGRPAFVEPTDESITPIIARLASTPPPDLRPLGVPDEVAAVLDQAMAKEPGDRPPTAQAFGDALWEAAARHGLPPVRMVVTTERTSRADVGAAGATTTPPPPPASAAPPEPDPDPEVETSAPPATDHQEASEATPPLDPYGTRDVDAADLAAADVHQTVHLTPGSGPAAEVTPPPAPPGALDSGGSAAGSAPRAARRRGRGLLVGAGVLLVLVLLGGGALILVGGDDGDRAADGEATTSAGGPGAPSGADGVARAGEVVAAPVEVGTAPLGVAVSDGRVYVADLDDDTVTVLDDASGDVQATLPVDGRPRRVAAAEDDGVWVTVAGTNEVAKVNQDGEGQRLPVGGDPIGVAEGFGSVWVVNGADRSLSRISTDTQELEATITDVAGDPRQVTTGGDAVWVSDHEADEVVRIDPSTNRVTDRIPVGAEPIGMAFGDGLVWATTSGDGRVVRIDPTSLAVAGATPVGETPVAVAVADGAAWVANQGGDTVSRIDVTSGAVTATVAVGDQPGGVAVGEDAVWVTNMGDGTVSRITAAT